MGRRPVARYADADELKRATFAECVKRVNARAGQNACTAEFITSIRNSVVDTTSDELRHEARQLYGELRDLLQRIRAFAPKYRTDLATTYAHSNSANALVHFLEKADEHSPVLTGKSTMRYRDGSELVVPNLDSCYEDAWTTRRRLFAFYDQPGLLWWGAERPKPVDLAILSILAGHWPKTDRVDTPAKVIEEEAKNVRHARDQQRAAQAEARLRGQADDKPSAEAVRAAYVGMCEDKARKS